MLVEHGHAVRGTSRDEASLAAIEAAGAHGVVADPDRLSTLMPQLDGVSVLCWLMGSARGGAEDLHGPRLESLVEALVDTHVRGVVYEGGGSVERRLLDQGAEIVRRVGETFACPPRWWSTTRPITPAGSTRWRPPSSECSRRNAERKSAGGVGVPPAPLRRGGRLAGARHRLPHRRYPHGGTPKPL